MVVGINWVEAMYNIIIIINNTNISIKNNNNTTTNNSININTNIISNNNTTSSTIPDQQHQHQQQQQLHQRQRKTTSITSRAAASSTARSGKCVRACSNSCLCQLFYANVIVRPGVTEHRRRLNIIKHNRLVVINSKSELAIRKTNKIQA